MPESTNEKVAWLTGRYPLLDGWVWVHSFAYGGWSACRVDSRGATVERIWCEANTGLGLRIHTSATGVPMRADVVEQVLAVARLDPEEIGRERVAVPYPDNANRYHSYMRGWKNGACVNAMDPSFTGRPSEDPLRAEYEQGYSDGRVARSRAAATSSERSGYEPSILRLAGES